jgi:fumarylacetoacetase
MTPSWVESANRRRADFPLDNLPWCRFNGGRLGVAIGDLVLDVTGCTEAGLLSGYDRARITALLRDDSTERPPDSLLKRQAEVAFELPFEIRNYTDFYASIHHATNVGRLFRPENPLLPNYRHVPIAYHGRASSIVISGTPVRRPQGQLGEGRFGYTEQLDFEMELGVFIGEGNELGCPISVTDAERRIAGFCIVNDWSARDIQRWEYQPLGPFLGKSFATSISPWVVSPEALAPYRLTIEDRPETLPYLRPAGAAYDITLEVWLNGELIGCSHERELFWTFSQMIAHHSSNGCNLLHGDLLASGTISGPGQKQRGCLLEMERGFLADCDEVVMTAYAERPGRPRIGFGECRGVVTST